MRDSFFRGRVHFSSLYLLARVDLGRCVDPFLNPFALSTHMILKNRMREGGTMVKGSRWVLVKDEIAIHDLQDG